MSRFYIMGNESQLIAHKRVVDTLQGIQFIVPEDGYDPLDSRAVDGIVLLDIEEKPYWIGAAYEAGIPVLATHPIYRRLTTNDIAKREQQWAHLSIMSHGRNTVFSRKLARAQSNMDPSAYFMIDLDLDSCDELLSRAEYVDQAMLGLCDLLLYTWGPVDLLYSRMRNFFHSGPSADTTTAMLRMRNGVEGLLRVCDFPSHQPNLRVRSYTGDNLLDVNSIWSFELDDLVGYYRNIHDTVNGTAQPLLALNQVGESYRLLNWMQKSARSDTLLSFKDSR